MPFCDTRTPTSIHLHYQIHGSGPEKVLLVMGFASDHTLWDYQIKHFEQESIYTVCTFDNRGVGFSSAPNERYTTSLMANDALDLIKHLEWSNVHLVGYSMGGMIAQELCLIAPSRTITSLALVATTAGRSIPSFKSLIHVGRQSVNMSIAEHFAWACEIVHPSDWLNKRPLTSPSKTNRDLLWEWRLERLKRCPERLTATGFNGQRMAVASHFVSSFRLKKIKSLGIPAIVIVGAKDQLIRPSNSIYLARMLNCGHGILHQYSDEFNRLITMYLSGKIDMGDPLLAQVGKFTHGSEFNFDLGVLKFIRKGLQALPVVWKAGERALLANLFGRQQKSIEGSPGSLIKKESFEFSPASPMMMSYD